MAERYFSPYETHVWVLRHLLSTHRPNVLELGCGFFSTPLWLRHGCERVVSLDDSLSWQGHVVAYLESAGLLDERLTIEAVPDVAREVSEYDLDEYDLIFIDNGQGGSPDRAPAIHAVLKEQPFCPIVVHDYDVAEYREAVLEHQPPEITVYDDFEPFTAVVTGWGRTPEEAERTDRKSVV